jgi:hypothetical protein
VLIKEMPLHLMGWDQRGHDYTSFLVAIALTKELFDASEGMPEQLGGVLGGDGEWECPTVGVVRLIGTTIGHEKQEPRVSPSTQDLLRMLCVHAASRQ